MPESKTNETTDSELVSRAQAGDMDAFEALTTRYEERVFSLAMRILRQQQDAEDVTQQTFLSALQNVAGFRGDAAFSTWLLRIATHAALKVIRKQKGLPTVSLEEAVEPSDAYETIPHPEVHCGLAAVSGTVGAAERNPAPPGCRPRQTRRQTSHGVPPA